MLATPRMNTLMGFADPQSYSLGCKYAGGHNRVTEVVWVSSLFIYLQCCDLSAVPLGSALSCDSRTLLSVVRLSLNRVCFGFCQVGGKNKQNEII